MSGNQKKNEEIFEEDYFNENDGDYDYGNNDIEDGSIAGKSNNFIIEEKFLFEIVGSAMKFGFSDIYIEEESELSFIKSGEVIQVKESNFKKFGLSKAIVNTMDFDNFLSSIFPKEEDKLKMSNSLRDKEDFDYGISIRIKNLKNEEVNIRLRMIFINTLKGRLLNIRPGLDKVYSTKHITDLSWSYNIEDDRKNAEKIKERLSMQGGHIAKKLEAMDFLYEHLKKDFRRNQGLILVTGMTGQGKTTQLEVNNNISDFLVGIRATKRLNGKILYIQEIRDNETAKALLGIIGTGVLVVTTLHTGSVPITLQRISSLMKDQNTDQQYINNFLADELISIINQKIIKVNIGGKNVNKVILEYLHVGNGEKMNIRKGTEGMPIIQGKLLDSPPHTSITKILWYLYLSNQIELDVLFENITSYDSLKSLLKGDKSLIDNEKDLIRIFDFLSMDEDERKDVGGIHYKPI
ncbi:MAG: ATPase, T2SS/T4P/T4SS family [Candidatus Gracilibacteria bacterium]|nr:ATPase, T2SS/T4P/T4SS family [Candidatus Gracilibacteria bacterium]